tara:strand:+ start:2184 stop:2582 length:399 start_codon:yes stop_codon:yes gene_type:complete
MINKEYMFIVYNYTINMNTHKSNDVGNRDKSYSIDSTSHTIDSDSTHSSRHSSFEICFTLEDTSNNQIDVYEKIKSEKTTTDNKSTPKPIPKPIKYITRRKRDHRCNHNIAYSPPDMVEYLQKLMIYTNTHK